MAALVLKAVLAPSLIGLASWIARRWGPGVGGWFTALPLTSGPVVLVLAYERGPSFAAAASVGTLLALTSLCGFALAYGWSAQRLSWSGSSLIGSSAYLACTALLQYWSIPLAPTFLAVCGILIFGIRAMPTHAATKRRSPAPAWDIPVRMALAAVVVVGITASAAKLGPHVSGLLTPFPVAATILAAFVHHFDGFAAAQQFLRGLLRGLFSFALFFFVVGTLIERWSIHTTFAVATGASFICHAALWIGTRERRPATIRAAEVPK
jgi:hypothetical protein